MFEIKLLIDYIKKLNPSFAASDFVDKAHFVVTCGLMLFFAAIIGSKQIWGEPISCFVPPEVPDSWAAYIKGYCYVTSTYNIKANGDIMVWDEDYVTADEKTNVAYYQWVPYMLVVQALLFFLPHLMWRLFQSSQTDVAFEHVVKKCAAGRDMTLDKKKAEIKDVTDDLIKTHDFRQVKCKTKGLGSAGFVAYVLSKVVNVCNVLFQMYLLNWFVGRQSLTWGLQAIRDGIQLFPRVSMCLFKQNVFAGIQSHSVQCLLMTNVINEKVFILLYVWLVLLFVVSVLNLMHLLFNYVIRRNDMVERYLQGRQGPLRSETFASWNLGFDGLLLLRFVENSAGFMMASTLAQALYDSLEKESIVDKNGIGGMDINGEKDEVRQGLSKQLTDIQKPSDQKKEGSPLLKFSSA